MAGRNGGAAGRELTKREGTTLEDAKVRNVKRRVKRRIEEAKVAAEKRRDDDVTMARLSCLRHVVEKIRNRAGWLFAERHDIEAEAVREVASLFDDDIKVQEAMLKLIRKGTLLGPEEKT